jgi:hypothetical protein
MAERLGVSEKTVEKHRSRIMSQLGVTSVVKLVRLITLLKVQGPNSETRRLVTQRPNSYSTQPGTAGEVV